MPSALAALGLGPEDEALPEAYRGEGVMPVAAAAARAVNTPGTELDGTEVSGSQRGLRGRWVELRRRRRRPGGETETPADRPRTARAPRPRTRGSRRRCEPGRSPAAVDQSCWKIARIRSRLV